MTTKDDDVVLDPRGGAYYPTEGVLAVADLHVGYEAALREAGAAVPRHEVDALLPALRALVDAHRPDVLVLNGDVKHAFERRLLEEARHVRAVWSFLAERVERVVVIEGNHDAKLQAMLPDAEIIPHYRAGRTVFTHGHLAKAVPRERGDRLVLGHEHPVVLLRDEVGVGVRAPAFLRRPATRGRGEVLVLPALAPWAAGYDALRRGPFLSPLLARHDRGDYEAWVPNGDEVLRFGEVRRLRDVLR